MRGFRRSCDALSISTFNFNQCRRNNREAQFFIFLGTLRISSAGFSGAGLAGCSAGAGLVAGFAASGGVAGGAAGGGVAGFSFGFSFGVSAPFAVGTVGVSGMVG